MEAADILDDLPPGVKFYPDDDELVELYLLPCVRGQPEAIPGVIVEDNMAANTLPWILLQRHHLADDDEAYFYVRSSDDAKEKNRRCDGGGTWTIQRTYVYDACVGGEKIKFSRSNLNLRKGGGKSVSTGWVMHEYTITEPHCPFLRICHVPFTGHGQNRKREPDDHDDYCQDESATKPARVDATAAHSRFAEQEPVQLLSQDQEPLQVPAGSWTIDQDAGMAHNCAAVLEPFPLLSDEEISKMVDDLAQDGEPFLVFEGHLVPAMEQVVEDVRMPSLCGEPDIGNMADGTLDVVNWEGFCFY